jgi:hypothetical protein
MVAFIKYILHLLKTIVLLCSFSETIKLELLIHIYGAEIFKNNLPFSFKGRTKLMSP